MDKPVLGFVGAGFVGGAMIRAFSGYNDRVVYDKGLKIGSMQEVIDQADVIFVALPTPMRKDGSCDTRLVEEVMRDIDQLCGEAVRSREVVLRSTVPPMFLRNLGESLCYTDLVYMPEFLTERTADLDFITASRFILGSYNEDACAMTRQVLEERFPRTRIAVTSWEEASMVKYATNVFFTIKLSFLNELVQQCEAIEDHGGQCEWETVRNEFINDGRIGRSHFQVPGPDGDRGWGGICFPKDNRGFSYFCETDLECDAMMADAAWDVNESVRTDRGWETERGRAVSED